MIAFRTLLGAAVLTAPFGLLAQSAAPKAPADLIVTNARVYTADDARPLVEAFAKIFRGSGECAEVGWKLLGLSVAEWSLVWFILLGAWAVYIAVAARRQ